MKHNPIQKYRTINQGYDPDMMHKVHDEMCNHIQKLEYENEILRIKLKEAISIIKNEPHFENDDPVTQFCIYAEQALKEEQP